MTATTTWCTPSWRQLGLKPHLLSGELIGSLAGIVRRNAHRVRPELLRPTYDWHQAA